MNLANNIPSVAKPPIKPNLREKMKWTGIMLVIFFILGSITVWGIDPSKIAQFTFLEIVFGSKLGSLMTLGIGPIVTASIILQLLVGSKIIGWNLQDKGDKAKFTASQKLLAIAFCFIEGAAYVLAGAIPPAGGGLEIALIVIMQIAAGGILVLFMDEVVSKWGIGSGISLFIAAGVSKTIFIRIFGLPFGEEGGGGIIYSIVTSLGAGDPTTAFLSLLPLIATFSVFIIAIFAQAMKIEVPMAFSMPFGKFGSRKWPLKFLYTSNIPVILMAALIANLQVMARVFESRGFAILGTHDATTGAATSGLMYFLTVPQSVGLLIVTVPAGIFALLFGYMASRLLGKFVIRSTLLGAIVGAVFGYAIINFYALPGVVGLDIIRSLTYMAAFIIGSMVFSMFWVNTAGMDSHTVAEQFKTYSIMIPGFRHDPRIIERVLERYIPALTILGGALIGLLASYADLTGALGTGTGILLTVMIIYQFYEQIMNQHYEEIPESIRKVIA
ncbi:MAG TPA: preprotein translocase subunit SecY [archaeon]|nr:preprotein translocase subunit SecY [archaeon]